MSSKRGALAFMHVENNENIEQCEKYRAEDRRYKWLIPPGSGISLDSCSFPN